MRMVPPVLALLLALPIVHLQETTAPAAPKNPVEEGRYLVEHVAMCSQCHTPRDEAGNLDKTRMLRGAPVPVRSPFRERWAVRAPQIAGLPGHSDEDVRRLLTEGLTRHGRPPMPPMPPYRMSIADADAVILYLKSLR